MPGSNLDSIGWNSASDHSAMETSIRQASTDPYSAIEANTDPITVDWNDWRMAIVTDFEINEY